jgi:putative FmdB family regulatory protein
MRDQVEGVTVPLYEYECQKCHHRFEEIQRLGDPPIKKCPKCKKGGVKKLLSSPAVHFKGTGWYVTDYARKQPASSESSEKEKETKDKEAAGKPGKETKKEAAQEGGASKDAGKESGKESSKESKKEPGKKGSRKD